MVHIYIVYVHNTLSILHLLFVQLQFLWCVHTKQQSKFFVIDPNFIQKTRILKVVCLSYRRQTWQSLSSGFLQGGIMMWLCLNHSKMLILGSYRCSKPDGFSSVTNGTISSHSLTKRHICSMDTRICVLKDKASADGWLAVNIYWFLTHQLWNCRSPETDGEANIVFYEGGSCGIRSTFFTFDTLSTFCW